MTVQQIEKEMLTLPMQERLRLAQILLSTIEIDAFGMDKDSESTAHNPLLEIAGALSGGPGNLSERVNEVVAEEIERKHQKRAA